MDICEDNAEAIVDTLDLFIEALGGCDTGCRTRSRLNPRGARPGVRCPPRARESQPLPEELIEVRIPVPDRTGVIAEIAVLVTELGINIVDLEIAHSVAGRQGVLVLVVDKLSAPTLLATLANRGYRATGTPVGPIRERAIPIGPDLVGPRGRRALGQPSVPGDKSISHRALLLAALAEGTSTISGLSPGDDVARTREAIVALGAEVEAGDDGSSGSALTVHGGRSRLGAPADRSTWATREPACACSPGWSPLWPERPP